MSAREAGRRARSSCACTAVCTTRTFRRNPVYGDRPASGSAKERARCPRLSDGGGAGSGHRGALLRECLPIRKYRLSSFISLRRTPRRPDRATWWSAEAPHDESQSHLGSSSSIGALHRARTNGSSPNIAKPRASGDRRSEVKGEGRYFRPGGHERSRSPDGLGPRRPVPSQRCKTESAARPLAARALRLAIQPKWQM